MRLTLVVGPECYDEGAAEVTAAAAAVSQSATKPQPGATERTPATRCRQGERSVAAAKMPKQSSVDELTGKECDDYDVDDLRCDRCKRPDNEDEMVLCDGCDNARHTFCCEPRLLGVPAGDWFCGRCHASKKKSPTKQLLVAHPFDGEPVVDSTACNGGLCSICQCNFDELLQDTLCLKLSKCGHTFCAACIEEWFSKGRNRCPNCEQYNSLRHSTSTTAKVLCASFNVQDMLASTTNAGLDQVSEHVVAAVAASTVARSTESEPSTAVCKVCGQSEHRASMRLCGGCKGAYHSDCVTVHVSATPGHRTWYCDDQDCRLQVAAQCVRRRYTNHKSATSLRLTKSHSKLPRLQRACKEAGLWAGGSVTELCMRLARYDLGLPALPLDHVRQMFTVGSCVKMLFGDNVWYSGWVLSMPDNAGCIDVVFTDNEVERQVPLLVGDTLSGEVVSLETDISAVVSDILGALVDTVHCQGEDKMDTLENAAAAANDDTAQRNCSRKKAATSISQQSTATFAAARGSSTDCYSAGDRVAVQFWRPPQTFDGVVRSVLSQRRIVVDFDDGDTFEVDIRQQPVTKLPAKQPAQTAQQPTRGNNLCAELVEPDFPPPTRPSERHSAGTQQQKSKQHILTDTDKALHFLAKIKARFTTDDSVYKKFLEIIQAHGRKACTVLETHEQVSILFKAQPDLVDEFALFLPERYQDKQQPRFQAPQPQQPLEDPKAGCNVVASKDEGQHKKKTRVLPPGMLLHANSRTSVSGSTESNPRSGNGNGGSNSTSRVAAGGCVDVGVVRDTASSSPTYPGFFEPYEDELLRRMCESEGEGGWASKSAKFATARSGMTRHVQVPSLCLHP